MSNIVIVDDDAALKILAENLGLSGHHVEVFPTVSTAMASLATIASSDIVVLDIFMDVPGTHTDLLASGVRKSGMIVHKAIREKNATIPILVYSASQDADTIAIIQADPYSSFIGKFDAPSMRDMIAHIQSKLGVRTVAEKPRAFIVHGHNDGLKNELKNYLQNVLHFPEPVILHEQPNMGRTIIEKFEDYASMSDLAFVLLTPDDVGAVVDHPDIQKRRARQNVIFEMGFFLGVLGRETGRVILLYKGSLELPSDISGVVYVPIDSTIEAAGEAIRRELEHAIR